MCSGGPDSMALLDIVFNGNHEIIVAHVNYKKRETADRDEVIVREYCGKRGIRMEVLYPHFDYQYNFQGWARDVRYEFAVKVARENGCDQIMVAHHLDDLLETYIMQKKRGAVPSHYGISDTVEYKGCFLKRPLLDRTKKDLENYCLERGIPYGIDESNLSDDYQRNRIRHRIIDNMTDGEKFRMRDEIRELNEAKAAKEAAYRELAADNRFCRIETFREIDDKELFLRIFIDMGLSSSYIEELTRQILNSDKLEIEINGKLLIKEYGVFYVMGSDEAYSYTFDRLEYVEREYFGVKKTGSGFEAVTVTADDYPLTIRSFRKGDRIRMKYGTKKLSRWFIDNKVMTCYRRKWPVVCNRHGEIILVPGIGCNLLHFSNNPTFFVVQYLINQ